MHPRPSWLFSTPVRRRIGTRHPPHNPKHTPPMPGHRNLGCICVCVCWHTSNKRQRSGGGAAVWRQPAAAHGGPGAPPAVRGGGARRSAAQAVARCSGAPASDRWRSCARNARCARCGGQFPPFFGFVCYCTYVWWGGSGGAICMKTHKITDKSGNGNSNCTGQAQVQARRAFLSRPARCSLVQFETPHCRFNTRTMPHPRRLAPADVSPPQS